VRLHTRLFVLALAMGVLVIGAIAWPMWQGRVYVADDLGIFHLAARAFYARSLAQGDSFLWWPDVLCGYYLHGEGQAGLYHPLHLLLYRTLPLATAFTLELVLHYPFLLAGTFLVLRRWGFERDAAMFGALVFTFSSFNFLHFVHPNIVAVIAHVPWLLLAIDVVLCDSDARRVAFAKVAVGLLTASQLLVGHPQAVWLSAVIELLYVLFRRGAWSGPGRLWSLAASISFGILGGMIQLLPTWDAMSESVRAAPGTLAAYRAFDSMKPVNLVQLVGPYLLKARVSGRSTQDYALYTGATASVLWIWLLMRRRQLGLLKPLASGVIALTVIGLLLAFGKYGYVYRLQAYIPLVNSFGVPVRYVVLVQFAFAVGAALAFADLARVGERQAAAAWRELWPLAAVGAVSVALAGAALVVRAQSDRFPDLAAQIASPAAIGLGAGLVVVAAALAIAAARGSRAALAGLIVFAVVDQAAYGLSFIRRPYPPALIADVVNGQAQPPDAVPSRVQSTNNFLTMGGFKLAGGYVAFRPRRQLDELAPVRLEIAGVRWIQARPPWAAEREVPRLDAALTGDTRVTYDAAGGRSTWARVPAQLPRIRLLTRDAASASPMRDINAIDLQSTALVSEALNLERGEPGAVSIVTDKPGAIQVRATVPSRQLVVLSESWHEGWRVTVDGRPRPLVRVYGDFMGAVVEAGDRDVAFRFQPWSFRVGGWLSVAGLALLLADGIRSARHGSARR